ncbi:hypothetical protein PV325_011365 [Microctonus aethiopoides]|nr:hypothetical protein PV325_011365 [Microctonus aethiopoides]
MMISFAIFKEFNAKKFTEKSRTFLNFRPVCVLDTSLDTIFKTSYCLYLELRATIIINVHAQIEAYNNHEHTIYDPHTTPWNQTYFTKRDLRNLLEFRGCHETRCIARSLLPGSSTLTELELASRCKLQHELGRQVVLTSHRTCFLYQQLMSFKPFVSFTFYPSRNFVRTLDLHIARFVGIEDLHLARLEGIEDLHLARLEEIEGIKKVRMNIKDMKGIGNSLFITHEVHAVLFEVEKFEITTAKLYRYAVGNRGVRSDIYELQRACARAGSREKIDMYLN